MRRSLPFLVLLLATAAGCSKSSPDRAPQSGPAQSYDTSGNAAESSAMSGRASRDGGPNIGVTAAPGVAFAYNYAFSLPPTGIAEVQERHALMCEQLTAAHCRITGMFYRVNNAHNVEASLAFRLDPAIARRFGRDAVEVVSGAQGMLIESDITGTDVGTQIHAATRTLAELQADLQRLEAQSRAPNLAPDEKARLEEQAQQLRDQIRATGTQRDEAQASLATTPMEFHYASGEPTLSQSLQDMGDSLLGSLDILLRVLIALLPWSIAAGIVAAIVFFVRRRLARKAAAREAEAG
jgi:hypothetical protein